MVRLARTGVAAVQNDPTAADYDALKLVRIAIPVREVFAAEPRDERWAPLIEDRVSRNVGRDFEAVLPGARVTRVECHTMVCRVELGADDRETLKKAVRLFGYTPRAPRADYVGGGGRLKTTVYLTFDKETRDPDEQDRWYSAVRALKLRKLRSLPLQPSDPAIPPA